MILIVDDAEDHARTLRALLTHFGCPCHWVATGEGALSAIRTHPSGQPLLVVLDDHLPGMRGLDVLAAIRRDETISQTPVVIYGSGMDAGERKIAKLHGVKTWLVKGSLRSIDSVVEEIIQAYIKAGGSRHGPGVEPKH
jgi:CheY-like chemotaxis protein